MNNEDYINNLNRKSVINFINKVDSNIVVKRKTETKISDTSWIDMIEDAIPYLDSIIRNPRRFIVQEENVVPIEKAKVVTEESIKHLAQNTNLIQEVQDDGSVIPLKLLNVYREETVDLYENRFIKSLVDNLFDFVNNKLNESDQKSFSNVSNYVSYNGMLKGNAEAVNVNIMLSSRKNMIIKNDNNEHPIEERIAHIKEILNYWQNSTFIKSLKESSAVRSPIRKTNVILKEPNFIKALELWEYLEKNNIKPITKTSSEEKMITSNGIKELYDLAFFIANDALDEPKEEKREINAAGISKIVSEFVYNNNLNETDFKRLLQHEFKVANDRKKKTINQIKATIELFVNDFAKRKKKAYLSLK